MRYYISFLVLITLILQTPAQNNIIDSLQSQLSAEHSIKNYKILVQLIEQYSYINLDSALYYGHKAVETSKFYNNKEQQAEAYKMMVLVCRQYARMEKALELIYENIRLRKAIGDKTAEALSITECSDIFYTMGILDSSLHYDMLALKIYQELNNPAGQAGILLNIGQTQNELGQYNLALEYYFRGLDLVEKIDSKKHIGDFLNNIGSVYDKMQRSRDALDYYQKAYKQRIQSNDSVGIGGSLTNIGIIYDKLGKLDSAVIYYQKGLEMNKKTKMWQFVAITLENMASAYSRLGQYNKAIDAAIQSLGLFKKFRFMKGIVDSYYFMGQTYFNMNSYDSALNSYKNCLNVAKEIGNLPGMANGWHGIALTYKELGDYEKAYEANIVYHQLQDSINASDIHKSVAEIETKYKTEKTKNENEQLKLKQEKDRIDRRNLLILAGLLIALLALLIIIVVSRTKASRKNREFFMKEKMLNEKLKQSAKAEKVHYEEIIFAEKKINELHKDKIIAKNRELTTLLMSINSKSKIIDEIKNKVDEVEKSGNVEIKDLSAVKKLLVNQQSVEEDWNIFSSQIEQVYPGFFEKLRIRNIELSQHDLRLCSYLLIDMGTKEIAGLLNVSEAAIIKQRQRVRKKLNFETNDDFLLFLRQI